MDQILTFDFNQEANCLFFGHSKGFKVYRVEPLQFLLSRNFQAQIPFLSMYYRSNIFALCCVSSLYNRKKLVLWDDKANQQAGFACFSQQVLYVKLIKHFIAIGSQTRTLLFTFPQLKILDSRETITNQKGVLALSEDNKQQPLLAFFGMERGQVGINLYRQKRTISIQAHQSTIAMLQFAGEYGQRLITCSEKGTNIRIFDTYKGDTIQELLRGNQYANIYHIITDPLGIWLAISSDSCNIHLFALKMIPNEEEKINKPAVSNPVSILKCCSFLMPSLAHDKSFAYYKISDFDSKMKTRLAFNKQGNLLVASNRGELYEVEFDRINGGVMRLLAKHNVWGMEVND